MLGKKNRKLSSEDVSSSLSEDTFIASESPTLSSPQSEDLIEVTLDQVDKSSLNPRTNRNPKYEEIKESIRRRGLDQPPSLTKRTPEQEKWEIARGGNSRLEILSDLYNEYKELSAKAKDIAKKIEYDQAANRFFKFKARIVEWEGERKAYVSHVIENELHSPMSFKEKAVVVKNLKAMFEADLRDPDKLPEFMDLGFDSLLADGESLSSRQLAKLITYDGWPMQPGNLTRFQYAADVLLDIIPTAFDSGAGHELVARIRKFGNAYLNYISSKIDDAKSSKDLFNSLWFEALSSNDSSKLNWESVRNTMESSITKHLDVERSVVSSEIDVSLANSDKDKVVTVAPCNTSNEPSNNAVSTAESNDSGEQQSIAAKAPVSELSDSSTEKGTNPQENPSSGLNDLVAKLTAKWSLDNLVVNDEQLAITKPDKPFPPEDESRYIWLRLFTMLPAEIDGLDDAILVAFNSSSSANAYYESQQFFIKDKSKQPDLKILRKIEDLVIESYDVEGNGNANNS